MDARSNFETGESSGSDKTSSIREAQELLDVLLLYSIINKDFEMENEGRIVIRDDSEEARESPERLALLRWKEWVEEKWYSIAIQITIPFIVAGIGTIFTGVLLGYVKKYEVFEKMDSLLILVPALIGLKGNLDMCMASRLSTQANMDTAQSHRTRFGLVLSNIALVQIQAIVAASVVSLFTFGVSSAMSGQFKWSEGLLLTTSSIMTATSCCFVLDCLLSMVIFGCKKMNLNPDNFATPVAASFGDVLCLGVFSHISNYLYQYRESHLWVFGVLLVLYLMVYLPILIVSVRNNRHIKGLLTSGWWPVFGALIISGLGGLVLNNAADRFLGYVVFQPIINGVGGNLASVQSSRISTWLHITTAKGVLPPRTSLWTTPWNALIGRDTNARTACIMLTISLALQPVFMVTAQELASLLTPPGTIFPGLNVAFVFTYLLVATFQVALLLYAARLLVLWVWQREGDPDSICIPLLTALGDFLGSSLLLLGFQILRSTGAE